MTEALQTAPVPAGGRGAGERIVLPGQSPAGEYVLSVLVKRTYRIVPNGMCTRADADRELVPGEVYWDHPMNSSVRFETDFWPIKPATDVVLNGTVHAPGGAQTSSCPATLQVNDRVKTVAVIGSRTARYAAGGPPVVTDPEPFITVPLRYERAYGGIDVYSDLKRPYPYPRNPVGRGFVVSNAAKPLESLALPNFEDPRALLTPQDLCVGTYAEWERKPMPAGFGWYSKLWYPRALLAGVLPRDREVEQELRQAYAQLIQDEDQRKAYVENGFRDMDFGFFNGASPGLVLPYLQGGETVATQNLSPEGRLSFRLPEERPRVGLDIGEGVQEPEVVLHTVMIHMDEREVDLVWRGAVPYRGPDWLPEMRTFDLQVA